MTFFPHCVVIELEKKWTFLRGALPQKLWVEGRGNLSMAELSFDYDGRRPGDPTVLMADIRLARQEFGWKPDHTDVREIIRTAWGA